MRGKKREWERKRGNDVSGKNKPKRKHPNDCHFFLIKEQKTGKKVKLSRPLGLFLGGEMA